MEQSTSQEPKESGDPLWEALEARCKAASLKYELVKGTSIQIALIQMPEEGSEQLQAVVWNANIKDVLEVDFESFRLINGYYGICSQAENSVEAFLEAALVNAPVRSILDEGAELEVPLRLEAGGVTIEIGQPSKELIALLGGAKEGERGPGGTSIKIKGVSMDGPGTPRKVLERYSNAVLFQFDTKFKQPLVLSRRQQARLPSATAGGEGRELTFPSSEFDHEPMSLYWYGRSAHGLPLLEFFAYYQVLEFYYEHYVDAEGRRRIAQVLKNPEFSPHDDRHVAKVLRAAGRGSGNRRNERDQLLTTIRGCADAAEIRSFINADENRKKFFEEKDPRLTQKTLNVAVTDTELLQQLADRIYDLRCKIVHTKEGGNPEGVELLLPHSPEADRLDQDIALLRLIARQALSAASHPLA